MAQAGTSSRGSTVRSIAVAAKNILITGPPGIGKTTLVCNVCRQLRERGVVVHGFYTEEVRDRASSGRLKGARIGFDVVSLTGDQRGALARLHSNDDSKRWPRVGKYSVDVQAFEDVALPTLSLSKPQGKSPGVIVIDEIGKMESFSHTFVSVVQKLFQSGDTALLATIPTSQSIPIVKELRQRQDSLLFEVTADNRNTLVDTITRHFIAK